MFIGCNSGIDIFVRHSEGSVIIQNFRGREENIKIEEWKEAVTKFARQIKGFYTRSIPKRELADDFDRDGWNMFWEEYNSRLSAGAN